MKTILVTGGAGFIGSNLIERLVKDPDNRVLSLDNYSTGSRANHIPGAAYLEGNTADVGELITARPNIVYHLGEYARVEKSFEDMETLWRSNKDGTFAVLEFCRERGAKFVYAGSSTKFGDGGLGRDQSPYAWTKASNTELVKNYGVWFGLSYAVAYFYNVYGPREISTGGFATVIGIFKEHRRTGAPLPVVSPGTQKRIFTHVDDIVRGLILVGEKGVGDGYGLGAREEHSILEIARLFGGEIRTLPERRGNRMGSGIDVSRSQDELGWRAERRIEDYIREFLSSLAR